MWGIRNLSLAAGMYAATDANRAQWWRLQVAVDALDFLVISAEWRRGAVPGTSAAVDGIHRPRRGHSWSPVRLRRVAATVRDTETVDRALDEELDRLIADKRDG